MLEIGCFMTDIQEIKLNEVKVEVKLADTDDPIASKVKWEPAKSGGSNFKSQAIKEEDNCIVVSRSMGGKLFALCFAIPGAIALCSVPYNLIRGEYFLSVFMLLWGGIFAAVGFFMLFGIKPFTFDFTRGVYYRGKKMPFEASGDVEQHGYLSDIHAIQILSERIRSQDSGSYTSYELNLVMKDAQRVNVMDHGADVDEVAKKIASQLGIPIWKASY